MQIVLVHGWGFTPAMWQPVQDRLGRAAAMVDLGFFGPAEMGLPTGQPLLAVGHSLGLLWLLTRACLPEGSVVLGINGFTRFSRAEDFPAGVMPRVLDRMMKGLERDAAPVLRQFRENCGLSGQEAERIGNPETTRLMEGLNLLQTGDARLQGHHVQAALASRDDAIVSLAMTEASFPPERIEWLETGGHLLPLTHPDRCATFILEACEEFSADGR
ncbi:alpha/beta fold hydrolase [Acetobacter sp.]|jgi:pimeloyl-[acyl-carrier protein] methyl ester esterase|uniref:alpha/beta fold hydrolase n=1 Tax=Acetobacter sp. TaxID=440 RepID=UPI0025BF77FE|nr:alpha/beta hydrolase [Acetobacter sp.]MCH4091470.1 alpha/beta hydrolase [Acetobacter sp.]MCI1299448.1 alpha/beta hydrolase [Acetobacter sp.]MCI1316962.1 alpha/beta hydrolase [Acetobacter sp.]